MTKKRKWPEYEYKWQNRLDTCKHDSYKPACSCLSLNCAFVVVVVVVVGGEFHVQVVDMNTNYSFEVFVCLAVLKEYKNELLKSSEVSSVYNTIHR